MDYPASLFHRARKAAACLALTLAWLGASHLSARPGDTRTISFYHIHTKETLTVTYKKNGKFVPDALKQINHHMRDWRLNQEIPIDPNTVDLLWEMHTELGSREPIHVICGYRAPATNTMLRKTRGGQASQSQHMTGKAIDVAFPDIPAKQLRYSAMIRERGGVGYYPTSAIPFVHVDTSRVRHWPRMGRDELALLFPSGRSQHNPSSGGPITADDVRSARAKQKDMAQQVAAFFELRSRPKKDTMLALAEPVPQPKAAARPPKKPGPVVAALTPPPAPSPVKRAGGDVPKLVAEPRTAERPASFKREPRDKRDRQQMEQLVTLASLEKFNAGVPKPAEPPQAPPAVAVPNAPARNAEAMAEEAATVASDRAALARLAEAKTSAEADEATGRFGWGSSFVRAPDYDEDHPEELAYRPFPLEPMMTAKADDPQLSQLQPLDVGRTLDLMDDGGAVAPMRLRPKEKVAQAMWSQQFQGSVVSRMPSEGEASVGPVPKGLNERSVTTTVR
ncbi:MAG: DUF882 domain-containing protein [Hyphomicrobiaceae bacterium]|nr:DUF882 domain-containing protein [Hyphomicrobiaceae bacterium]